MNHPEHILRTLDRFLTRPARLILYGRAALSLGFPDPLESFHSTMDVDAILPEVEMAAIEADDSFWEAIDKLNADLEPSGLYLTHLFTDRQVILRPDWLHHLQSVSLPGFRHLTLARPATEDLILTKMMRVDPQDRQDIRFLLHHLPLPPSTLRLALETARIPEIPEIQQAFAENRAWLLGLI